MTLQHIPTEIRGEFTIGRDGRVTVSRRGIARLCGVDEKSIRGLLARVKGADFLGAKSLEKLAQTGFKGADFLSDIAATQILEYYAFDAKGRCTEQAKTVFRAFAAIGLRSWVQAELGWTRPPQDDLRLSSTEVRKESMAALHAAGFVEARHFINVTQAAYKGLFGMTAKTLRKERGLPDGCNVRDHLNDEELAALRLIEINLRNTLSTIVFAQSSDVNNHVKTVASSIRASLASGAVRPQLGV